MTLVKAQEIIGGVQCEVHVTGEGMFEVYPKGENATRLGYAETMERAIAQARPKIAKRKVKVEVVFFTKAGERGVATGFHSKNGNVMARIDDRSVQLKYGEELKGLHPSTPREKMERMIECREQSKKLLAEARDIEYEYTFDLKDAVEAAVAAKAEPLSDTTQ